MLFLIFLCLNQQFKGELIVKVIGVSAKEIITIITIINKRVWYSLKKGIILKR